MERLIKYEGELDLNGLIIPCYVLSDGTRVLSGRGMQEAMRVRDIPKKGEKRGGYILPVFLESKALNPFIVNKIGMAKPEPIICYKGKSRIHGYEATVLADICDSILEARKQGVRLTDRQTVVADQCEILMRSFAKVGIIALVDEATGYQYEREKRELQAILKIMISDEILKWQEAFHLSFYKEIFRLWNIPFTSLNIRRKPQFIGHLTNKLIYNNLPKGMYILEKLKKKTPKTTGGNYRFRLHQSLTPDVGREALKKVIYSIEALASVSINKRQFLKLVEERYGQKEIPFPDLDELDPPGPELSDFNKKLHKALDYNPKK